MLAGWTDYPFVAVGDVPHQEAPVRKCEVLACDGNKYCRVRVDGVPGEHEIKAGYVYREEGRYGSPNFPSYELNSLPRP